MKSTDKTNQPTERLWTLSFIVIILNSFFASLSYFLIHTLVTSYALSFGAELAAAGSAVGAFSIASMIIRPFSGFFADRLNKKVLLALTTALMGIALILYSGCHSVGMLFFIRIFHGVAFGVNGTANIALAAEYIPKSRTGEGLGYYGIGQVASQIVGPPLGLALKDMIGYNMLFLGDAIFTVAVAGAFMLAFRYKKVEKRSLSLKELFPHVEGQNRFKKIIGSLIAVECIFYALMGGLFSMGNSIVNGFLVVLGETKGIANISLFFTINAIMLFVLRLTVGKALDRTKLIVIVLASMFTGAVSMALVGWSGILIPILAASVIKAFGNVGGQVSLQSACVKKVDIARVGVATSTFYIGADIGNGFGPVWGGIAAAKYGIESPFFIMAGIFIAGMVIFAVYEMLTANKNAAKAKQQEA
ncbi:MAG: MFS transporter [Lachnospiraceae bacterium]|nr:MFS transporter [Lachnospiraceae bacterium]